MNIEFWFNDKIKKSNLGKHVIGIKPSKANPVAIPSWTSSNFPQTPITLSERPCVVVWI